jgi:hypothetical protein
MSEWKEVSRGMLKRLKLRWIFRRRKMEAELEEELRYHLEREVARQIESGMDPREARMAALRGFGGFKQKKEECRDAVATRLIEELWQDLQYGGDEGRSDSRLTTRVNIAKMIQPRPLRKFSV